MTKGPDRFISPDGVRTETEREADAAAREQSAWTGPDSHRRGRSSIRWKPVLWRLIYPAKGQRVYPTASGLILIALALGIGTAAYNTANNILFITLSLLLSCLILSGVLSWMNFARLSWRLRVAPALRAHQETLLMLDLRNGKTVLPSYGLSFQLRIDGDEHLAPSLALRRRLEPGGGQVALEWSWRPARRGAIHVELVSVGSLFPFGFLRKTFPGHLRHDVIVWPAPVEYRRHAVAALTQPLVGRQVSRMGQSGDLLAVRAYSPGDSHRLIHWKASARTRELLVRQFAAEAQDGFSLWVDTSAERWPRPEQFEVLVALAATLAEDLFKAGNLGFVSVDREPPRRVCRVADLEAFLDRLAVLTVRTGPLGSGPAGSRVGGGSPFRVRRNLLTFAPDGPRGVSAFIDGQRAATA